MREYNIYPVWTVYNFVSLAYKLTYLIIKHTLYILKTGAGFMRRILFITLILLPYWTFSQSYKKDTVILSSLKSLSEEENVYTINPGMEITSLTCKVYENKSFDGIYIIAAGDTIYPILDTERGVEDGLLSSELIILRNKVNLFLLHTKGNLDEIVFFYINSSMPEKLSPNVEVKKKLSENCSEPASIDQEVWRVGLDTKDFLRIVHTVSNIIIHHSAGSIYSADYTQVVRSIYIFHTFDRGWDDIGYNYLIANDGSIFKGRDPGEYEQDNVKGAHFCGYNSGTMGICVMGTYTDTIPSDTAQTSLVSLLTWKIVKDNLNPVGTHWHTLNDTLPVIAGHRDGCATECPGLKFYETFPEIRLRVNDSASLCPGWDPSSINLQELDNISVNLFPNPAKDILNFTSNTPITSVGIIDMLGRKYNNIIIEHINNDVQALNISSLNKGAYILILQNNKGYVSKKFFVY